MIANYAVWYTFLRIHKTLRVTPAMAADLCDNVKTWEQIVEAINADAPKPRKRGAYKKLRNLHDPHRHRMATTAAQSAPYRLLTAQQIEKRTIFQNIRTYR